MRVVVAEDSAVLREGLVHLLARRGHQTVAAVAGPDALRAAVAHERPDIALVDIRMPPTHTDEGLRAAITLRRDHPGQPVLVFSHYVETQWVADLLATGPEGVGYLLKDRAADVGDFVDSLERVALGGIALDPEVVSHLIGRRPGALGRLTPRESQVLALMAEGRSNAGIQQGLVLSAGAVDKHINAIFAKLDLPASEGDNRRVLAVLRCLGA